MVDKELKDRGTTLRIEQAIADRYSAVVLMDFVAPEGTVLDGDYYILGDHDYLGLRATSSEGTELNTLSTEFTLLEDEDPADNHISLLFTIHDIAGKFNFLGGELSMDFEGLYDSNVTENALAEGRWKCKVTLPQEDPGVCTVLDTPINIGENQVTLHSLYLSPISLTLELRQGQDHMETIGRDVNDSEKWQKQVILNTIEGQGLPVGDCNFLHTIYTSDSGLYSFRLESIMDPAQVASVTLFGQTFSLKDKKSIL